jgi:hypothetical protein
MNLVLFKRVPIILVTGSNARSHHLLTRMFHHAADLRTWKIAIRTKAVVDEKLGLGPLSAPVSTVADLAMAATRVIQRAATPAGVEVRSLSAFDSQALALSRRCELPGRLLVRRSDEYLNWRFVRNPRCAYRIVGAFRDNRLEGYVVTRLNLRRPNPRREGEIVDWLAAPANQAADSVLPSLMQAGLDGLIDEGAAIVSCVAAASGIDMTLEPLGFRFRPGERVPFFVKAAEPSVRSRLSSGTSWLLTRGDIDVE